MLAYLAKEGGQWKYAGNQRLADIRVRPYAEKRNVYTFNSGTASGTTSSSESRGLHIYVDVFEAIDAGTDHQITQAVVTGPCLSAGGLTLTPHNYLGYLLVPSGADNGLIDTSACTEAVGDNQEYTVVLTYGGGSTASYPVRAGAPLFGASEAIFTSFTSPSTPYALSQIANQSSMTVTWDLPTHYSAGELDARSICGGSGSGSTDNVMAANGSKQMTSGGGNFNFDVVNTCTNPADRGWLSLRSHDPLGRYVYTTYSVERQ